MSPVSCDNNTLVGDHLWQKHREEDREGHLFLCRDECVQTAYENGKVMSCEKGGSYNS